MKPENLIATFVVPKVPSDTCGLTSPEVFTWDDFFVKLRLINLNDRAIRITIAYEDE
jgi:hypothetical protein